MGKKRGAKPRYVNKLIVFDVENDASKKTWKIPKIINEDYTWQLQFGKSDVKYRTESSYLSRKWTPLYRT